MYTFKKNSNLTNESPNYSGYFYREIGSKRIIMPESKWWYCHIHNEVSLYCEKEYGRI